MITNGSNGGWANSSGKFDPHKANNEFMSTKGNTGFKHQAIGNSTQDKFMRQSIQKQSPKKIESPKKQFALQGSQYGVI